MPSSYSPDLRLELPADGEQTGLWGQTTNRNLGTLIESAIAGATSVSVTTANQALTALNGADDQSRHAMLVLTTTTEANFAVYAPPASKTYIVRNASSYTATIYNSTVLGNTTAAGAGVAVPAGKSVVVFSDGTDFRTIDAVNLTGTLAVANGGTGATDASGARTNLGLVIGTNVPSPTGTGASGTWNISILGNAATATSATTATQLASTLAIAAGGTGQTTAAGAFNALKQAATESATGVVELATTAEAAAGTDTIRAVTAAGVEAHMVANALGWGQTWQAVTRTSGVDYQNTTGRPILLCCTYSGRNGKTYVGVSTGSYVQVAGNVTSLADDGNSRPVHSVIVPNGHYYKMVGSINNAVELR